MKKISTLLVALLSAAYSQQVKAQGLHFSQYYNAPLLMSPANTGLMPDNDYRVGINYRNQWSSVPVPYKTISAYADFQALHSSSFSNWLGVGLAFYNDKAGDGDLSLNRTEAFVAYHLQLGTESMLSFGVSGAYAQRSVDFNKLTFDTQWDGFEFNGSLPNGEKAGVIKTHYMDVTAGLNYAYFPNENVYIQVGLGLAHVNQPKESFYGMENQMGMRPTANFDASFRLNNTVIVNPSAYYTSEKGASELMYGTLVQFYVGGEGRTASQLILGGYNRWNEAVIPVFGYEWSGMRLMTSYDFTISKLAPYNNSQGAFEIALRFQGLYSSGGTARKLYNCPRFF
ncbi:PorP/SprF family type IX secretion system membrane protein [Chitinophagaceae bacterium MMS25-I14]